MIEQTTSWKQAQAVARRQFAGEELAEQINKAVGVSGEAFSSANVNRVIKWIDQQERAATLGHPERKAKVFVESFAAGELREIKSSLAEIGQNLAALPTMRGTPVGSAQRVLHYALGELGAKGLGYPGLGGIAGVASGELISRALQSTSGRAFVRQAMKIHPVTSPEFNATIAAWLRATEASRR